MKAIAIREDTLAEIAPEVSRKLLRRLKRTAKLAERLDVTIFFIPWYEYPLTAGIPREFIVSEEYMFKYFNPLGFYENSYWMKITPDRIAS